MPKSTEQNNNLKWETITSLALHLIIFSALIYGSIDKHIDVPINNYNSPIDAVMVDRVVVVQNYSRQQLQQTSAKHAEDEEQNKKQAQEQQKHIEKTAMETKTKGDVQKKSETKTTKKTAQKKNKKYAVEKLETALDVDNLLDDLSSNRNAPKAGNKTEENETFSDGSRKTTNTDMSDMSINNYAEQIKSAIESRFYDASSYAGKTCTLRMKLASDGMLLQIKSEGGDIALCNAALIAARQAIIPKPPSQAVYEVFKNTSLDFKP